MNLKPFLKTAIVDIVSAMEESSKELGREIHIGLQGDSKSVEFDIAVTAESALSGQATTGIKVLGVGLDAELKGDTKQSEISRIKFRAYIPSKKFEKQEEDRKNMNAQNKQTKS